MLTQEKLKEFLDYNSESGKFTWIKKPGKNNIKIYDIAGTYQNGYIKISFYKKQYLAHRLIWLYMTGDWPKECIDHINGVRDDNRWCNLREATYLENNRNAALKSHNKSGFVGVSFCNDRKKFMAHISINNKFKNLGRFETAKEASDAYKTKAKELFGEFYREIN